MTGTFVTIASAGFAFIRPDGDRYNVFASAEAMAALPHPPSRGDRVQFQVTETPDGRRRAHDLVAIYAAQ